MVAVISDQFQGDKASNQTQWLTHFDFQHIQMEEAKKAIEKLDVDKDGRVSYPEFILVMKYKK